MLLLSIFIFAAALASSVSGVEWGIPGVPEWITYIEDTFTDDVFDESEVDAHTVRFYGVVVDHNANGDGLSFCVTQQGKASTHHLPRTCCALSRQVKEGHSYMCEVPLRDEVGPVSYSVSALRTHKPIPNAACWSGFTVVVGDARDYTLVYSGTLLASFGFPWQLNTGEAARTFGELETVCAWMVSSRPGWVERLEIHNASRQSSYLGHGYLELAEDDLTIIRSPCTTPNDTCLPRSNNVSLIVAELNFQRAVEHPRYRGLPLVKLDMQSVYLSDTNELLEPCNTNSTDRETCFAVEVEVDSKGLESQESRRLKVFPNGTLPARVYTLVEATHLQTNGAGIEVHLRYLQLLVLTVTSLFFPLT